MNSGDVSSILNSVEEARAESIASRLLSARFVQKDILIFRTAKQVYRRGGIITFSLSKAREKLPAGFWYKGGLARNALRQILGKSQQLARDIDVVAIGPVLQSKLMEMSRHFSPEDLRHGHGIEQLRTQKEYFSSRDFSLNEVLYNGDRLICSEAALSATRSGAIELVTNKVTDLVALKGLRLLINEGDRMRSEDFLQQVQGTAVSSFALTLNLDRMQGREALLLKLIKELAITLEKTSQR